MRVYRDGEAVHVRPLKRDGVVTAVLGADTYRVAVGSLVTVCRSRDLTSPKRPPAPPTPIARPQPRRGNSVAASLDLHGASVADAINRLDGWISDLIVAGTEQGKVVHGLGSGALQRAVHKRLAELPVVRAFRISDLNPGVTDIFL